MDRQDSTGDTVLVKSRTTVERLQKGAKHCRVVAEERGVKKIEKKYIGPVAFGIVQFVTDWRKSKFSGILQHCRL